MRTFARFVPIAISPVILAWASAALAAPLTENGVPQNGFPSYEERSMLAAINRVRADPNNVAKGTSAACSTSYPAEPPFVYDLNSGRPSGPGRCVNSMINGGGLSHNCTAP